MKKEAKSIVPAFMANLRQVVSPSSKVLVVCHKNVRWAFETYRESHGFAAFDVGTWGALDGRNDWRDFDTLAILGLPHLPRRWATGIYMALQGFQDEKWLNKHQAICDELHDGFIVTELVQAIGRIRSRRVIDREGHCDTGKVFLALGGERKAKEYLRSIHDQLPGVRIDTTWAFDHGKRAKQSKSDFRGVLLAYVESLTAGFYSASAVRQAIGIGRAQWFRLVSEIQDGTSRLSRILRDGGVRYRVEGKGRGARSWLVKD